MPDTRTHIERINDWPDQSQQESSMTPEQFAELKALITDFLTPVKALAEKHLAWMTAAEAQAAAATPAATEPDPGAG